MSSFYLKNPKKRFTTSYILALSVIAVMTILSQFLIKSFLNMQEKDARIINISGRQRMLSQKITKIALLLNLYENKDEFKVHLEDFSHTVTLWNQSHNGLINRQENMSLSGENSSTIKRMFKDLMPHYIAINQASKQIIKSKGQHIKTNLPAILNHESSFLKGMNEITFQYDFESTERIKKLELIELTLLAFTIITLLLEAFLIFRPAVSALNAYIFKLSERNNALMKANETILETEKQKLILEKKAKSELELKIQERTKEIEEQKEEILQQSNKLHSQNERINDQNDTLMLVNKKLTDSINYASTIQKSLIGSRSHLINSFEDGFITFKPKNIVSGDFFWFKKINDHQKLIIVADCTGHGVPGAFMTVVGNLLLNEIVLNNQITSPSKILYELDQKIDFTLNSKREKQITDGMDAGVILLDESQNLLIFSGARRPLYYRCNAAENFSKIKGSRFSLGQSSIHLTKEFEEINIEYEKHDRFYLSSDGFQDQFGGEKNTKYLTKRFHTFLEQLSELPMYGQKAVLEREFKEWKGKNQQTDDVLILGIEV